MPKKNILKFDPSARLQSLMGRELISNEYVAMAEVVRNAYDAGATEITIRLISGDPQKFIIVDDGSGMSRGEFEKVWMTPGYSLKAEPSAAKTLLGEKGIGRFAVDKIARKLIVTTKIASRRESLRVIFDWDKFGNQNKKLKDIEVPVSEVFDEDMSKLGSGTRLELTGLRKQWKESDWNELRGELQKLISPSGANFRFKIIANSSSWASGTLVPKFDGGEAYQYFFSIDKQGKGIWTLTRPKKILDELRRAGHSVKEQESGTLIVEKSFGAVKGHFYFFEKASQITRQGFEAGVAIYRDGFRVEPYGRSNDDWVEVKLLKSKRHGKVPITPSRLFGYVQISRASNPGLRDLTNREGIQDSDEFEAFRTFVMNQFLDLAGFVGEDKEYLPVAKSIKAQQRSASRETKSEELATLADQLAHQLKQPLTIIGTNLATMRLHLEELGVFDDETQKYHERIDGSVSRLNYSIEGLASLSKDLKGRASNFDLIKAVEEIVSMHRQSFDAHGITLQTEVVLETANVRFSKPVLNFVLENFLTNALKATTASKVPAPVVVRVTRSDGGKIRVLVEDSGVKIPAILAKSLFDQPVSSSDGWGKGLYYSRLRVEPYNGTLDWFAGGDSKTFYLELDG